MESAHPNNGKSKTGPAHRGFNGEDIAAPFFSDYEEIGRGESHVLYRARRYGRWHALKGLRENLRDNPFYEEWLYKEYSVGICLDHPNIVRVESMEDDPRVGRCIVMEWVEGQTLDRWTAAVQPSCAERRKILGMLFDAVQYCHMHGIYHHDLKPANIIVTPSGSVKLIDFGLSDGPQYAALKMNAGTEGYAAPEQRQGGLCDHRADIYSLGKITSLMFPRQYRPVVNKAMSGDPKRRHPSVEAFRSKLRRPRWPWVAALFAVIGLVSFLLIHPSQRIRTISIPSGQTVYYRVIENFPHRKVALVCPGTYTDPWPMTMGQLSGAMAIPESISLHGLRYRVTDINGSAFANQFNLSSLQLPESIESIGIEAFRACNGLNDTLYIPHSLTFLGNDVFNDCSNIKTVVWGADSCSVTMGLDAYFYFYRCSSIQEVIISPNVRYLPERLFSHTEDLRVIDIEGRVQTLPKDLFAYTHKLDSIHFPATLHTIGHGCFYKSGITRLYFPKSLRVISHYAFAYCPRLRHIELGANIRYIGNYSFAECSALESVTVHAATPPALQPTSFDKLPSTAVLRVPQESLDAYRSHPYWGLFHTIVGL